MKIKATIDKQELEIEVDEKELVKAGYVKTKKEYKRWRAKSNDEYFSVDTCGFVYSSLDNRGAEEGSAYRLGNYYQTKELAQAALDRQLALVRVNDRIVELNEGWTGGKYKEGAWIDYSIPGEQFETNEHMGSYVNCRKIDDMANEAVADQIISECESDLKIIFGV